MSHHHCLDGFPSHLSHCLIILSKLWGSWYRLFSDWLNIIPDCYFSAIFLAVYMIPIMHPVQLKKGTTPLSTVYSSLHIWQMSGRRASRASKSWSATSCLVPFTSLPLVLVNQARWAPNWENIPDHLCMYSPAEFSQTLTQASLKPTCISVWATVLPLDLDCLPTYQICYAGIRSCEGQLHKLQQLHHHHLL